MVSALAWVAALCLFSSTLCQAQVAFDIPRSVISDPPDAGVSSPTLREDEREVFIESAGDIYRGFRENTGPPFLETIRVPELSTVEFVEESPFLSADGLRIYFTRRDFGSRVREIWCAEREGFNSPFGEAVSLGPNGTEPLIGNMGSLTGDELKVYFEIIRPVPPESGKQLTEQGDIAAATRNSPSEPFGPWTFVDGVNTLDWERDPFVTRDDNTLVYSRFGPVSGLPGSIFFSSRPEGGGEFPEGDLATGINSGNSASEDPFLAFPGARIYFLQGGNLVTAQRLINAMYILPDVEAPTGSLFFYPIVVTTSEADIFQFDFRLGFDTFFLDWVGVVSAAGHPGQVLSAGLGLTPAILEVSYRTDEPIPAGDDTTVLLIKFVLKGIATTGQRGTFRISGDPELNGIPASRPPAGSVLFGQPLDPPAISLFRVR